ncbi:MAG TPA: fumarylacetoacetate hydrolase family protein [Ktedonobacteraceae bacterium]|nr:fumarylacetoacetate hydrolase family protein [Ktedonobacteraceae bacterium]
MKLLTFRTPDNATHAGVIRGNEVIELEYPSLLEWQRDPDGLARARQALEDEGKEYHSEVPVQGEPEPRYGTARVKGGTGKSYPLNDITLLAPIPEPPSIRDFYAFEQHVKKARALRGLGMIPEWYEVPIFYFTNPGEVYGTDQPIPYPEGSQELDIELEIACVIGREGKNIPVEEADQYIAGYTIMNDWSARDFQRRDMKLNLGPGKGKDFATSLGPWLVTPDELAQYRTGSGASERYNMPMVARVNGKEISHGNFDQIYYSFPQMIAWASQNARLRIGDVLGSGTVGTGCILELGIEIQPWLQKGDVVELEVEGLGVLRNRII